MRASHFMISDTTRGAAMRARAKVIRAAGGIDAAISTGRITKVIDMTLSEGLSVVHVPVYCGPDELGGLGAWGQWNVGNWCEDVQREWVEQDL